MPIISILLAALVAALGQSTRADVMVHVDARHVVNRVTPWMTGSCIEDVNHEIYGGLYAQMIFGESFEEPPATTSPLNDWKAFGGSWSVGDGACHVEPEAGAKLVRETPSFENGTVDCDVRLDDDKGDNAGLILRVADPRTGADSWIGYEVSISFRNHAVILGRHRNNWTLLRSAPATVTVGRWHRLRATLEGSLIRVWLDPRSDKRSRPAIEFDDGAESLPAGRVGVRTWNSHAAFRNLVIQTGPRNSEDPMDRAASSTQGQQVSGMWTAFHTGSAEARFDWDADRPYNSQHAQRIEHKGGTGTVGIFNQGLNRWGLAVRSGSSRYAGHLYLRQREGSPGLIVALQSSDGSRTYGQSRLRPGGNEWARRDFTLSSNTTDPNTRFAVWLDGPGLVWIDQVVVMPCGPGLFHNLPVRADIANAMEAEGLTFLRYGGSMVNAPGYRWKQMVGDRDRRPEYNGTWYPQSTNGFGIEEFVQYCRAAHIEPAFAINIEETPEDAADLVEYFNGSATSTWGAKRASNGHPAPYHVRFIEIGNEESTNAHYLERFKLLEAAMHRVDPALQLVIAAWWEPNNPVSRQIVQELNGKAALWDVHVGGDDLREGRNVDALFTRMEQLVREWAPGTPLKACIFEENGDRHDLQRALGHAHILNATERHGDFVLMDCPVNCLQPLRQNDNGWNQGQIFFTPDHVWGMPPYYAQQMAARNYLPLRIESRTEGAPDLDVTATRSEDGRTLVLKVVNIGTTPIDSILQLAGFAGITPRAEVWTLTGDLKAINTPDHPKATQWRQTTITTAAERFTYTFPATSYTILRLHRR